MNRLTAAVGSVLFFAVAPGVVAGLVPWWLTRWQVRGALAHWAPVRVGGLILLILGAIVLAGELSLMAAFTSQDLARAHEKLGRSEPLGPKPLPS